MLIYHTKSKNIFKKCPKYCAFTIISNVNKTTTQGESKAGHKKVLENSLHLKIRPNASLEMKEH